MLSYVSAMRTFFWQFSRAMGRPARRDLLVRMSNFLRWTLDPRLPTRFAHDVLPGLSNMKVTIEVDLEHPFELPYGERALLAGIVRLRRPGMVFEIGTFTGRTTRVIADSLPVEGTVHTLDLPPGENRFDPGIHERVGEAFRDSTEYDGRIVQHHGNSRTFDFSPWHGKVDLVFIDGSHEYEDVLADSRTALRMIREGGIVIWDDYDFRIPGVVGALNTLRRDLPVVHLAGTRLALYVHRPPGR